MATYSEVKQGLDEISAQIRAVQTRYNSAKSNIEAGSEALGAIPTKYADVIATIDGYTPTGAFETLSKDEKAKLQTEFQALKSTIDALIATTEFSA
jgi:flagellin-like hook-associated protein FlgL